MRFPIRFSGPNRLMVLLGILPSRSRVELDDAELRVRMSWAFRADVPRASLGRPTPYDGRVLGWGAHGWRGRWLVNGSSKGIVQIPIDPPARARVLGWPVKLTELDVSLEDREAFIATLSG